MNVLLWIITGCAVVLAYCVFMMEVLPRFRSAYYVTGRAGVRIGPFYTQRAADRYAQGRGLAAIDPARCTATIPNRQD